MINATNKRPVPTKLKIRNKHCSGLLLYFAPPYAQMRDMVQDALQCVRQFCKQKTIDERDPKVSFRAIGCTWQCQQLLDTDRTTPKGVQVRIREDRNGDELSQSLRLVRVQIS